MVVVRAGFEPAIFAAKGRRFTGAMLDPLAYLTSKIVGTVGVEPTTTSSSS
jgi:hypothetical protein